MRKAMLSNGRPVLLVKVLHAIDKGTFAIALRDHYYSKSEPFDSKLSKKEAMEILVSGLRLFGEKGEIDNEQYDGAAQSVWDELNGLYAAAIKWIDKHYPYLNS